MLMRHLHCLCLTAALAAAAPIAHGASPGAVSGELTRLQVQLTDLTPDDNVTPFLAPASNGYIWSALQLDATSTGTNAYIDQRFAVDYYASLPVGNGSVSFDTAGISAIAERDATRLFSSLSGVPSANVYGYAWWETYPTISLSPGGDTLWTGTFLLSAGTSLTFTADYSVAASIAAGYDGSADTQVVIRGTVGSASIDDMTSDWVNLVVSAGQTQTDTGGLSVTLSNTSDVTMPVFIGANVFTHLQMAAVPEPSSLALLTAGGLLVGWRVRRARRSGSENQH